MKTLILEGITSLKENRQPLKQAEVPEPVISSREVLVKVSACGVCHTELDEIEGRTLPPYFPIVLGHQVVGRVEKLGKSTNLYKLGDRVGVGWVYSSCGKCKFCLNDEENLCHD